MIICSIILLLYYTDNVGEKSEKNPCDRGIEMHKGVI